MTERTIASPVVDRRVRLEPNAPVITSEWTLEDHTVSGQLHFASCASERTWTSSQQRTVHREPPRGLGWLLLASGSVVETVGLVTRDSTLGTQPSPTTCTYPDVYNSCKAPSTPDTSESDAAIVLGAAAAVTGVVILAVHPKDQTTVLKSERHTESTRGSCILPSDFSTLVLVLQVGENRYLHVDVSEAGAARVDLPPTLHLTPGADLPVVVYRGPAALADALPRLQVVGSVHVPQ